MDADDGDYDHELDQREASLSCRANSVEHVSSFLLVYLCSLSALTLAVDDAVVHVALTAGLPSLSQLACAYHHGTVGMFAPAAAGSSIFLPSVPARPHPFAGPATTT